jgi:hypothetical protein
VSSSVLKTSLLFENRAMLMSVLKSALSVVAGMLFMHIFKL